MKLLEFPHSHYCEKARWALDYKGVPFQAAAILPGFHIITVRRYAPGNTVPVLLDDNEAVQGSSEIINYLEQKYPSNPLTPEDSNERRTCLDIEAGMDIRLGENIRQVLYYRLLAYPDFIRDCFTHGMPFIKKQASINLGNQMNCSGDQAEGDKRDNKEDQKSEYASAQSGKNEIGHGMSPFLRRNASMNRDDERKYSNFIAKPVTIYIKAC